MDIVLLVLLIWAVVLLGGIFFLARIGNAMADEERRTANLFAREMLVVHSYWAEHDETEELRAQHAEWAKKLRYIAEVTS